MRKIVIEVSGGNIQEIYSTEKEDEAIVVYVIDWDNIKEGSCKEISEFPFRYCSKIGIREIIEEANIKIRKNKGNENT